MASPDLEHFADRVQEFKEITGAGHDIAMQMLEICNGDLQMAINMHVDGGAIEFGASDEDNAVRTPPPPPSPPPGGGNGSANVMDTASPLIAGLARPATTSSNGSTSGGGSSNRNLSFPNSEDDVRPPLPPKQEVLVDTFSAYGDSSSTSSWMSGHLGPFSRRTNHGSMRPASGSLTEPFRDLRREAQLQEAEMNERSGSTSGPSAGAIESRLTAINRKATALEDLYRPPLDLMFRGSFDGARNEGRVLNKWLLVNVIDPSSFPCQTLNRDVWSAEAVKDIVKNAFVFWQVYNTSEEAENYMRFYTIDSYPHVAILDPRTGERLIVWSKLDACTFAELVTDFLSYNSCPDPSATPASTTGGAHSAAASSTTSLSSSSGSSGSKGAQAAAPPTKRSKSSRNANPGSRGTTTGVGNVADDPVVIEDMDEDEQISAALAASLREHEQYKANSEGTNSSVPSIADEQGQTEDRPQTSYADYIGPDSDPKSELMFRYPDGERRVHSFPSTSKLKALILFAREQGFPESSHELVTNFPRRNLSELDSHLTLSQVGLFPKETVFIQLRSG